MTIQSATKGGKLYTNTAMGVSIYTNPNEGQIRVTSDRYRHIKNDYETLKTLDKENTGIANSLRGTQKLVMVIEDRTLRGNCPFINSFWVYCGYISEVSKKSVTLTSFFSPYKLTTENHIVEIIVIDEKVQKALEGSVLDKGPPPALIAYFDPKASV
jgi:hypothetical protein